MVSIIVFWKSSESRIMKKWLLLILLFSCSVIAQDAKLEDISIKNRSDHWLITPHYQLSLSNAIIEAIENGIEITFVSECQLLAEKSWWPDRLLTAASLQFEIHYFSLTSQYQLKGVNHDYLASFLNLSDLLSQLGQKTTFQLLDAPDASITTCRLYLEQRALPSTMQLPILWDDRWSLDSKWQRRPLPTGKRS